MHAWLWSRTARRIPVVLFLLLVATVARGAVAPANDERLSWRPSAVQGVPPAAEDWLSRGAVLERAFRWADAFSLYEEGRKRWPDEPAFPQGARRCESHLDLARRYADGSFRRSLSNLSPAQALTLYGEVLLKIQTHYVDPVDVAALVRRGTENLQVALADTVFLRTNLPGQSPERTAALRAEVTRLNQLPVRTRADAQGVVRRACDLGERMQGLPAAAVALEYVFGACAALDRHSAYLTADRLGDLYAQIDGSFVGIGVEVRADRDGLLLLAVIPSSPAAEQGLRAGDHIAAVNGRSLRGLGTDEAANQLAGPEGSSVEIAVVAAAGGPPRSLVIRRRAVALKSIGQARLADPHEGIAYLQLSGFQKTTAAELDAALWRLHRQGMRALILDLRGNPGGLLTSAVDVADRFVEAGTIVSTYGRAPGQSGRYSAGQARSWGMPLALLIDGDSASASEIVAACLADYRRAILVGRKTYGKGEVQSIYPLTAAHAGLRLTTARFYSPLGRPLSGRGVMPDVAVAIQRYPQQGAPALASDQAGSPDDPDLREALRVLRQQVARIRGEAG